MLPASVQAALEESAVLPEKTKRQTHIDEENRSGETIREDNGSQKEQERVSSMEAVTQLQRDLEKLELEGKTGRESAAEANSKLEMVSQCEAKAKSSMAPLRCCMQLNPSSK